MNLYFLLEGRRTEPKVYPKWINYKFPHLNRVHKMEDISADCFYLIAAKGYPRILKLIEQSITDIYNYNINNNKNIDHFFICLDADEDGYDTRYNIVNKEIERMKVEDSNIIEKHLPDFHVIIQNCCVETWFLGNRKIIKRNPQSKKLSIYKRFYDVSINDPEDMECYTNSPSYHSIKAKFHEDYLKEILLERNQRYSKLNPSITVEKYYYEALYERCFKTNHLKSLRTLFDIWNGLS